MPAAPSLTPLFLPRAIAVVGVRGGEFDPAERSGMARRFFELLVLHGFNGAVYPVNPRYETVGALRCYPDVSAIPGPVDLALLIVPKARMPETVQACGEKGVRVAVVISSGYAETGTEGRRDEEALVELARGYGMRVVGPNCFGLYNSSARANLFGSASLLTRPLLTGSIGLITQSGAVAASMVDRAQERGIGFGLVVTTGNQADVDNVECLEHMVEDAGIRVVALFAEAILKPARFRRALGRAARLGKPVVILKTGASEVGRRAALAHTGSLVGDDAVFEAVFRQDGAIRVEEPEDLFLAAALLARHGSPGSRAGAARVTVISMSGAMGGIVADVAGRHGVALAEIGAATRARLEAIPGVAGTLNPLDAANATWAGDFSAVGQIAGVLAADPEVDVVMLALSGLTYAERLVDDCAASVAAAGKVFVPMWGGDRQETFGPMLRLAGAGVTVYETCRSALAAIGALGQFRRHQARLHAAPDSASAAPDAARLARARTLLQGAGATLTEHASKALLALYGVPIAAEAIAADAQAAVAVAARIGYPVALKISSPDIAHKTEARAIALGLTDADAVRAAFASVMANARAYKATARIEGVLVCPMAPSGLELVVGAHRDAQFGPVLLVGLGGVLVEVLRDTAIRVAPVDAAQALQMLDELRGRALLEGVRGGAPVDRAAIVATIVALSTLMLELGDAVQAVDINPLIVHAAGRGASVADALVVLKETQVFAAIPGETQ